MGQGQEVSAIGTNVGKRFLKKNIGKTLHNPK